jgi:hypothetical protein
MPRKTPSESPSPSIHPHRWLDIASGRVCEICKRTQAQGEFDEIADCPGDAGVLPADGATPPLASS